MKDERFYGQLFRSVHEQIGPMDDTDIIPFVGFDRGGMIRLSSVGREQEGVATFITCELAVGSGQRPAKFGNYEFMITCDDQSWAREVLTHLGRMSYETAFEDGHALDISEAFGPEFPIQGLIVEEFTQASVDGQPYGIYRIHGVTRVELDFAIRSGVDKLIEEFKNAGIYSHTSTTRRRSVVDEPQSLQVPAEETLLSRRLRAISSS